MSSKNLQRGATLIITLIILTVLTLFVVSSTNLVSTDLRIASNVQGKKLAEFAAQQVIEQTLSSQTAFTHPAAGQTTLNGIQVASAPAECLTTSAVGGYYMTSSVQASLAPVNTQWDLHVSATDTVTGATATIHQGVAIRMPVGSECP